MSAMSAVSIYNYFTSCESGISVRATDNKLACRVYEKFIIAVKKFLNSSRKRFFNSRYEDFFKIFANLLLHSLFSSQFTFLRFVLWKNKFIVLGTDNYCIDPERFVIIVIFNSYLRFAVGTKVFHLFAFVSDSCQFLEEPVCQFNCEWHIIIHFTAGIAEHHSLVACSLFFRFIAYNTLVYIARLFMNS